MLGHQDGEKDTIPKKGEEEDQKTTRRRSSSVVGLPKKSTSLGDNHQSTTTTSGGVIITVYVESSQPRRRRLLLPFPPHNKCNIISPLTTMIRRRGRRRSAGGGGDRRAELLAYAHELRRSIMPQAQKPNEILRPDTTRPKKARWSIPLRKIGNGLGRLLFLRKRKEEYWRYERIETEELSRRRRYLSCCRTRVGSNSSSKISWLRNLLKKFPRGWMCKKKS